MPKRSRWDDSDDDSDDGSWQTYVKKKKESAPPLRPSAHVVPHQARPPSPNTAPPAKKATTQPPWMDPNDRPGPNIEQPEPEPEKPNFGLSGALAQDTRKGNMQDGVAMKHCEPEESRLPDLAWRAYMFDGDKEPGTVELYSRSAFLVGREETEAEDDGGNPFSTKGNGSVIQIQVNHSSVSGQHAVVQFRGMERKQPLAEDGILVAPRTFDLDIKPYLMDLESTTGTFLNGKKIEAARYYELYDEDVVNFGKSNVEYVIMKGKPLSKSEKERQEGGNSNVAKGGGFGL